MRSETTFHLKKCISVYRQQYATQCVKFVGSSHIKRFYAKLEYCIYNSIIDLLKTSPVREFNSVCFMHVLSLRIKFLSNVNCSCYHKSIVLMFLSPFSLCLCSSHDVTLHYGTRHMLLRRMKSDIQLVGYGVYGNFMYWDGLWFIVTCNLLLYCTVLQRRCLIEAETKWSPFSRRHFKCIFLNEKYKIRVRFHWSLFRRAQLIIFQHWFR